jgi:hypothetical protein
MQCRRPSEEIEMNRLPKTPVPPVDPPSTADARCSGKGLVGPATGTQSEDDLQMPHERDQGHGQVAAEPDPVIEQAAKDLAAGQVDTDMRATPGLDAARRARMVDTPPSRDKTNAKASAPRSRAKPPKHRPT